MKAHIYEQVKFSINPDDSKMKINLVWKDGGLYLSMTGIYLTDGEVWYELPLTDLKTIEVESEDPLHISFKASSVNVTVSGDKAQRLLALRHFLLPYILGANEHEDILSLLKFMALGVNDLAVLSEILEADEIQVRLLCEKARNRGLIDSELKLTTKGRSLLDQKDLQKISGAGGGSDGN